MTNIVIDTNVLLSAIYSDRGASYKLLSIIDSEKVSALQTLDIIEKRAKRASKKSFLEALSKVPSVEPDERDRL